MSPNQTRLVLGIAISLALGLNRSVSAATPPSLVNYQGVLRDNADKPLTGTYDMLFRFMDAATGGNEIMTDQHAASSGNPVTVTGGLFNVALGSGTVADGSAAGVYTALDAVFRDYGAVWLEVKVGTETLAPRTQIQSAPYALNAAAAVVATTAVNATQLNGYPSSNFLDISSTYQTKSGPLRVTSADPSIATLSVACSGTSMGYRSDSCVDYGAYLVSPSGTGVLGSGYYGARGYGTIGGYFDNAGQNVFYAGDGPDGAGGAAYGNTRGLFYSSSSENYGDIGFFDGFKYYGVWAHGYHTGGYFENTYTGTHTWLSDSDGSSVKGNGSKNFVQNHPQRDDRAIVYAALEGDEVGTYTRGSGKLTNGEARVKLGETFQWVTNPELGLTVYVTPKGAPARLYVAGKSTSEIVVKTAPGDPDVEFDYIVAGLRIGFERSNIVREKEAPEPVPSLAALDLQQSRHPELSSSTALARFEGMERASGRAPKSSYPKAAALLAQIQATDHAVTESPSAKLARLPETELQARAQSGAASIHMPLADGSPAAPVRRPVPDAAAPRSDLAQRAPEVVRPQPGLTFEVTEAVEQGDLLALDPQAPGKLRRASSPNDTNVVGIAEAGSSHVDGSERAAVVTTNYATVLADAQFGAIKPGDLLVSSSTPGHAMVAKAPLPGTVIGKALEGLDTGAAPIRVLVMSR